MNIITVFKKELKSYLCSPVVYVVLTVFLFLSGYFFYSNLVMVVMFQGTNIKVDLWQHTFNDIRFVMLILIPIITMRVFAEEKKLGTIELLFTSPLKDWEVVMGKYCACLIILALMLFFTFLYPLLFGIFFHFENGPVVAGYTGLFLLGAAFMSCGIFISSRTENQIIAAMATAGVFLLFWYIDSYEKIGGGLILNTLGHLSFQKHFYNFNRGVINTRDVVYFITACAFLVFLTLKSLELRCAERSTIKITGFKDRDIYWLRYICRGLLCFVVLIFCNVMAAACNQRFDLTPGKLFTLSHISDDVLKSLQKDLKVTVFYGTGERYQYEEMFDLMAQSSRKFRYNLTNFDSNPVKARNLGIDAPGAGIVECNGQHEYIPAVNEADIVKAILALKQTEEKIIRVIAAFEQNGREGSEKKSYKDVQKNIKAHGFRLEELVLKAGEKVPPDTVILWVAGQERKLSDPLLCAIGNFLESGGRVLIQLGRDSLPGITRFLRKYNIEAGNDIIIDRRHTSVDLDEFTPIVFLNREHPISKNVDTPVVFPVARSVQVGVTPTGDFSWVILAQSGRGTWAENNVRSAWNGTAEYSSEHGDIYGPVSVGVIAMQRGESRQSESRGRMIVLGNLDFISDEYFSILGNQDFFISMIRWLAKQKLPQENIIQSRMLLPPVTFISLTEHEDRLFFWLTVVMEPLMILFAGVAVILFRRFRR